MLDVNRLKTKISDAFDESAEVEDSDAARNRIAEKLATAIVEEIKALKITYDNGLVAPSGAVTGVFNHSVQ
jgi:hypothetical protein